MRKLRRSVYVIWLKWGLDRGLHLGPDSGSPSRRRGPAEEASKGSIFG